MLNKLLERQIHKYLGSNDPIPENLKTLLAVISESYDHYEKDRKMLERSIELTSEEMIELNNRLRKESENTRHEAYEAIRQSLNILNNDEKDLVSTLDTNEQLHDIVDLFKTEARKRKTAEKEFEQQQAHLNASQHIAHIGSWELELTNPDLSANTVYWSDELSKILEYEPGKVKMTSTTLFDRIHPDDRPLLMEALTQAIETHTIYEQEYNLLLPGDRIVPVYGRAEIVYDEQTGRPLKIIGTIQDISERKKTKIKLQKAHNELRTLFDNMQEVFYSVDMEEEYKLLQISKSCEDVYGYSVRDFVRNPNLWIDVVLEEDKHIIYANNEHMHAGRPFGQEYRILHKGGSIRWLESKLRPTLNNDGKLVRLDGTTADITKRKEAELALKINETRFRYLIDNCADAILIRNEEKTIIYCSDSVERVIGYAPDEVMGKETLNDIHPDDLDTVLAHWDEVLQTPGKPVTIEYRRMHKNGSYLWCEGTSTNMFGQPEIKGVVVNFRDITERKEAEIALKSSEDKFRSLIEHSSDALMILNEKGEITYASDSMHRVMGYTRQEVTGVKSVQFIHPDDKALIERNIEKVLNNPRKPSTVTYRRIKKDGTTIWCEGTANNLLDEPAVRGIVVNFRDVTDRKNYEDALKDSNLELQKSNAELDKFVYSVSHDLRAPLTSMAGIVSLVEIETGEAHTTAYCEMLKSSISKLDGFIHEILDYSRNARLELNAQNIDFKTLISDSINNLQYLDKDSDITVRMDIGNGYATASDKSRLSIIFNNLIANAIQYYNPDVSDPYIDISVEPLNDKINIRISDNGTGINENQQGKVFQMFYRGSHKSPGSGLGLYIVKETVEKLNGTILMQSEPGKGTTFHITIPNLITS